MPKSVYTQLTGPELNEHAYPLPILPHPLPISHTPTPPPPPHSYPLKVGAAFL